MSRGGHNWKGGGTVEGTRSLEVMKLAGADFLAGAMGGSWQWSQGGNTTASIQIVGGRNSITLNYRFQASGQEWQTVTQHVPICWTPCRFGGERPWFVCDVLANGVHCGRQVAKLFGAGRLFACRRCYRLGYRAQRGDRMDQAHHRLARLHRTLDADYDGPDGIPPRRPKWMRKRTYSQALQAIENGENRLDVVFTVGAQRIIDRSDRLHQRGRMRR